MYVLEARNVCQALVKGVEQLLSTFGVLEETRAGPALVAPCPVVTKTTNPRERVLFSRVRDANPFFHMYESVWMLAGRNDAVPLLGFVKGFDTYAEPDGTVHGAYGHRWREHFGVDQLEVVAEKLITNPGDRQTVITMWDPHYTAEPATLEEQIGSNDLCGTWKDRPCNTHVYLRVRSERDRSVLDIMVCCRSNDAIWGAHGANAVHFSVLHEYLAARIGVGVGVMYQVSNNYHAYAMEIQRLRDRTLYFKMDRTEVTGGSTLDLADDRYSRGVVPAPMFADPLHALRDAQTACDAHDAAWTNIEATSFTNPWFERTFMHAMLAHLLYKNGRHDEALKWCKAIEAPDWQTACREWLERRIRR